MHDRIARECGHQGIHGMDLEDDFVVADGDFFDFMFDIECDVLERIGDEQALRIHENDRRRGREAYERELREEGLDPKGFE